MADSRPESQGVHRPTQAQTDFMSVPTTSSLIFNNTYEFIGLLLPDGTLLDANQSALEFVGATLAQVQGRPFVTTPWWARDAKGRAHLQAGIAAAARGEFVRFEAQHHNPRGDAITVDFSLKPVRDEHGAVILLVPEGRDITERKQAEDTLRRAYDELEGKVRERTAALETEIAVRKQSEADALFLAQLSARIRHDGEAAALPREITNAVGEYLQVQRCFFTEVDLARDQFVIHQDYFEGVPTIASTYILSNFNPALVALTSTGKVLVVRDTNDDPHAANFEAYAQLDIHALVVVPLLREGRMVASLVIATASARDWQPREISLLETIAELTWQVLERLRAEAIADERDERLQSIVNHIDEIVWSANPDTSEQYFLSPAAESVYGRPLADFYANPKLWAEVIHPDDRGVGELAFQALAERGHYEVEYRIVRPDGEIRWLLDRGHYVRDDKGELLRLDGVAADITARKASQAALLTNEARFAGIINSAMDAIISVDNQQHIVLFNHAAEQMFGYTAAEMIGQSLERLLPASAHDKHAEHIRRFGKTKTTTRTMGALGAISGLRQSGEEFPIEASSRKSKHRDKSCTP